MRKILGSRDISEVSEGLSLTYLRHTETIVCALYPEPRFHLTLRLECWRFYNHRLRFREINHLVSKADVIQGCVCSATIGI